MKAIWGLFAAVALFGVMAGGCKWETKTQIDPAEEQAKEAKKQEKIAEAKRTFPTFVQKFEANGGNDATYSVKVHYTDDGGNTEDVWISGLMKIDDSHYRGGLADSPKNLPKLRMGDMVVFSLSDVIDWWIFHSDTSSEGRFTGY